MMTEIVAKYGNILKKNALFSGFTDEELATALDSLKASVSK